MRGSENHPARERRWPILAAAACLALLAGCTPYQLRTILDGPRGFALRIDPASTALPALGEVSFAADGGVPPYTYSIAAGGGTLDGGTGAYTAPATFGSVTVRVTDAAGRSADAQVSVQAFSAGIALLPLDTDLAVGSNVTLTVVGGTPPYTFTFDAQGTGTPSLGVISASTRLYATGGTPGTDVVRVTDSLSAWATASITASLLPSAVDYTIPATGLPGTGTVGAAMAAGSFTLANSGSGDGGQPVSWKVYLSADMTLNGGDTVIASGTTGALAAGASAPIAVAGTFPAVAAGGWHLIAEAKAADDTTDGNDVSGASPLTLDPPDVDYEVVASSPVSTGATIAGSVMDGTFTLQNTGTAGGAATVHWAVYASADTALGGDYLLDQDSLGGMAAGASTPVPVHGTWPSTPNTWYLIATVSADDDVDTSLNTEDGPAVTTTGPAPASIDYVVQSVTHTGGTTAGDPFTGTFTYRNILADAGLQPVHWIAYISSNTTLDIGTDMVADSGTEAGLPGTTTSGPIAFEGTWPPLNGSWYLIVTVSASDDTVPAPNMERTAAAIVTNPPPVNYRVLSMTNTGGTTAGGPLAGTLVFENMGTHDGTQAAPWNVYLSDNGSLELGADMLIASGTVPTPGLLQSGTSTQPFVGTWPAATSSKTWYLLGQVSAGDDPVPGNNLLPSAGVLVNPPDVRYSVPAVSSTGGTVAGAPLAGQFSVTNAGSAGGSSPVNWTAYVSADNTWQVTDQVLDTGTVAAVGAFGTSGPVPFAGTWPATAGPWYLIVRISAADDTTTADNETASGAGYGLTVLAPDYTITAVPLPAGTIAGQAVSGSFTVQNTGNAAGSGVSWSVYASLANSTWDAGDTLLATGSTGALGIGATSSPGYAGTWPSAPGNYYVIVRASAADDATIADRSSGAAVAVTAPPPPDYTVSFHALTPWSGIVGTAMGLTGTCQLTIQNLSVNPGNRTITWSVHLSLDNVLDAGDTLVQQGTTGALAGSGSTTAAYGGNWPGAPGQFYWLIASVHAADDALPINDVVPAPHACATGNYRYLEGAENNNGNGTNPPLAQTSNTGVTTLGAAETIVIEGAMDAFNQYDTYRFTTIASMSRLSMRAMWGTGFDDLDLYLWDTGATDLSSLNVGINSEPGGGTFDVTGVTPRTCFVSASMWLANNTSGSAGRPYVILVRGLP